jgi:beta-glucosidase
MEVAQVYASRVGGGWEAPRRLAGFQKVDLGRAASQTVSVTVDPRLLAMFDAASNEWRVAPGEYEFLVGESSRGTMPVARLNLQGLTLPANWRPGQAAAGLAPQRGERGR